MEDRKPNIIFLDIDGVLNNYDTKDRFRGFIGIDDKLVDILKEIVDRTDASIVLSSSWKDEWTNDPYLADDPHYDAGRYINAKLSRCRMRVLGKTKDEGINRGYGIRRWLDTHPHEGWIVIDDEVFPDFEVCGILPQLVFTKDEKEGIDGLRKCHVEDAAGKMGQEIKYTEYYDIRTTEKPSCDGFVHSGKAL